MPSTLFSKFKMRDLELSNRIVVSPMGQYSGDNGRRDRLAHDASWPFVSIGRGAADHRGDRRQSRKAG